MAGQRTTFAKLERDRAKKAKAAAKRERRQDAGEARPDDQGPDALAEDSGGELSAPQLLALIAAVHQRWEAGTITAEEFEETKADLLRRLPVD